MADEAGCSSDARRREAGEAGTLMQRGVPSTEAPSDMQPASAAAETAATSASRARAAESREQRSVRRACAAFLPRAPRARPPHCRRAASAAPGAAPSSASRASVGASQPAEAAPATASSFAGPKGGAAAAGLSRSVHAVKPKMRASRSGGSSCGAGAGTLRVSAPCAFSSSQRGAQGPAGACAFRAQRSAAPRSRANAAPTLAAEQSCREARAAGQMRARPARGALRRDCSRLAARSDALLCGAGNAP